MEKIWGWLIAMALYVGLYIISKIMFVVNIQSGVAAGLSPIVIMSNAKVAIPYIITCVQLPIAVLFVLILLIVWLVNRKVASEMQKIDSEYLLCEWWIFRGKNSP
jgi:hypothetical protein